MEIKYTKDSVVLSGKDGSIISSDSKKPFVFIGSGEETVDMYRGNFKISDYVTERRPLYIKDAKEDGGKVVLDLDGVLDAVFEVKDGLCVLSFNNKAGEGINRIWIRTDAKEDETVHGCGEQMSYFNLRGRNFPIWTSEPGVGRDKTTLLTWKMDVENGGAGGDYYNSNFPQPIYVSSRHYYFHADCFAYADFDFKHDNFHEMQFWKIPECIRIEEADSFVELLEKETAYLGRQPELPDWVYNGVVIGAQGGTERSFGIMEKSIEKGIKVSGLWCQDWCGKRVTSFGKRLQWDWHFHNEMYPDLPGEVKKLHDRGIKFLNYINPYLVEGGDLYNEGLKHDVFAKRHDGSVYLVDFGEFNCGVIDLTDPKAYEWFKNEVIIKHSLDIGMDGWMADFGEYLPTDDIVLHSGESAMVEHNRWPALWAKCNYDALVDTGKLGEVVYFMRAGGIGSQKYSTLMWAGDQSVDLSMHDGLRTVIVGALNAGMCGCGLSHSDIGGYTSMFDNLRTKEVFLRWSEMAAFTPFMRTHEGNRPETNFQYYDDDDCMEQFARLVDIYTMIAPYIKELVKENHEKGTPVQRPLFLHYEDDKACYKVEEEYLLGSEMLVAPVYLSDVDEWEVYLPDDEWIHLWSGAEYKSGKIRVSAPIGQPPVFYRKSGAHSALFESVRAKYGN